MKRLLYRYTLKRYCVDCKNYFKFYRIVKGDKDPDPAQPCPKSAKHKTRDPQIIDKEAYGVED